MLRCGFGVARRDLADEGRDRSANRRRVILLQKMHAVPELDQSAILEPAGEFCHDGRRDERAIGHLRIEDGELGQADIRVSQV